MRLKKLIGVMAFAGLAAPGIASATNGYFSHGYGMKSIGMGGVGIALPQDTLAAATNPAGMVMVGDRIDFGLNWFRPQREATITGNAAPVGVNGTYSGNEKENFFIPEFGYNKMLNPNMSLGVSVFGNGGMNTDYNKPIPLFDGRPAGAIRPGVNLEQLFVAPTFAMKLNPDHAIGISLNLAYQKFSAKGLYNFTAPGGPMQASASPANVTDLGSDSSTGAGVRIGWTGKITPNVTLGATYQSKTSMGNLDTYKGLFAEQGSFDIPASYGVGISAKVAPQWTVALDVMSIEYSKVKSIANPLSNFTVAGNLLGSSNGGGFGWKDMTVGKLGVSYEYSPTLTLRAGYNYGSSPISSSETFFNILAPGIVEDHLTLGATWTLPNKGELTVGYMHAFSKTINGSNSIPAPYGGGNANLNMHEDSLGIGYGWKM